MYANNPPSVNISVTVKAGVIRMKPQVFCTSEEQWGLVTTESHRLPRQFLRIQYDTCWEPQRCKEMHLYTNNLHCESRTETAGLPSQILPMNVKVIFLNGHKTADSHALPEGVHFFIILNFLLLCLQHLCTTCFHTGRLTLLPTFQ